VKSSVRRHNVYLGKAENSQFWTNYMNEGTEEVLLCDLIMKAFFRKIAKTFCVFNCSKFITRTSNCQPRL